ncbi:MAG TPA: NAD(+) synthase [Thermotogota bacterium]|nr:NAD(+) synthase [Thermotogota bacterium]HPJ90029.1 NAD(+) synthase [Thermotogota bacterium]HPR95552.1 NAD(+) synthase [Thermotogota bacterium]
MKKEIRIAINQINQVPGDLKNNTGMIKTGILMAEELDVDLIVFPYFSISGSDSLSLKKRTQFVRQSRRSLQEIIEFTVGKNSAVILSAYDSGDREEESCLLIHDGTIISVFREEEPGLFKINDELFALTAYREHYNQLNAFEELIGSDVRCLINLDSSYYYKGILEEHERLISARCREMDLTFVNANSAGTTDSKVYYGSSFVSDRNGEIKARAKSFEEDFLIYNFPCRERFLDLLNEFDTEYLSDFVEGIELVQKGGRSEVYPKTETLPSEVEAFYKAIKGSIKDYIGKNGFSKVVVGLSGGIDSALVTTLAVDALGKENVFGVMMPSEFSSDGSVKDAVKLAENLGIKTVLIPIKNVFEATMKELSVLFGEKEFNTTEENLQARIRGNYLMSVSNEYGYVVLNTGNKSEAAAGYSTLYGDTIGGYAPLTDLYKTECYALAKYINTMKKMEMIPVEILTKEPSAELSPGQKDSDSLPVYETLDEILQLMLEKNLSFSEIVGKGFAPEDVKKAFRLFRINEYKRRQEPLGPRLSKTGLTFDHDFPISNHFREEI